MLLPSVVAAANSPAAGVKNRGGTESGADAAAVAATQPVNAVATLTAEVTGTGSHLNIRSGPGTEYGVLK